MKKFTRNFLSAFTACMLIAGFAFSQMPEAISIEPPDATGWEELTLTLDANQSCPDGDLLSVSEVFIHSGVTINGEQWQNVISFDSLSQNGQSPELTDNGDGTWSITYVPADYYGIEEGTEITEICAVFNNGTWDHEGKDFDDQGNCTDFFIPLNTGGGNQNVLYEDDFESYNVGDMLAEVSDAWTTWSEEPGGPEDAPISDEQANSGTKSVKVAEGSSTDLILPLGDKITGHYSVSMYMYVDEGFGAYYNLLHDFDGGNSEWAIESFFASDGTGYINAGGTEAATFTYPTGQWFEVKTDINLDEDTAIYYVNENMVHGWQWSLTSEGDPGLNQLGAMDIFATAPSGDDYKFYFDDVMYEEMAPPPLYEDDFEAYNVGDMLAEVSDAWTTWSEEPGGPEDAPIVDEQANSGSQSVKVAEGSSTDLVLPLGDKITGEYSVSMYMYIDKNYGAYYNILHAFDGANSEWAIESFFASDGTGYINAGGSNSATFTYPTGAWFKVETIINLDEDTATYFVDETLVHGWQWSITASGDPGMNQLGAVDIFAHAPGGDNPNYYFDDIMYNQLGGGGGPADFELSETLLLATIEEGTTTTKNFDITSTGALDLEWSIVVTYPPEDMEPIQPTHTPHIINNSEPVANPDGKPSGNAASNAEEEVTLNYDGPNDNAIGLTEGGQWRVAAMFPIDMIQPHIGMELTSVEIYIGDMATAYKLQVYDMGVPTVPGAGELIYEQDFSPINDMWNTIELDEPVKVVGADLWVGYWIDQQEPAVFTAGVDAGPANPNGDWIATGGSWGHLSSNPELDANWNIRAHLTGEPQVQWLSADPMSGMLMPGESATIEVTLDATELVTDIYEGQLRVHTNAPLNPRKDVSVMLNVITGLDENEKESLMVYPVPATEYLNLQSSVRINEVRLLNYIGQVVHEDVIGNQQTRIDINTFDSGVYILEVNTEEGRFTQKIVIE